MRTDGDRYGTSKNHVATDITSRPGHFLDRSECFSALQVEQHGIWMYLVQRFLVLKVTRQDSLTKDLETVQVTLSGASAGYWKVTVLSNRK
jgi:hypothetical protein